MKPRILMSSIQPARPLQLRGLLTGQTSGPVVTPQRKRQLLATIANVEGAADPVTCRDPHPKIQPQALGVIVLYNTDIYIYT